MAYERSVLIVIKVIFILYSSKIIIFEIKKFFLFYRYGRRYTYIITTTMLLVGRFISLMGGNSYIIFFIGCLIASFPSTTALQTVSIICLEMSSVNRGSAIVRLRLVASSFGIFLTPLFMWWARDWKLFLIVTTAPLIPFVIMSW